MSTNTQLITDSLRLMKVLAEGETPSAEQASDALRSLNQMMASWEADTINLGYFAQTDTTATCPIPDWAEQGVYGKLAIRLCPEYGASLSPEALNVVDEGYTLILRRLILLGMTPADMSHLGAGGGKYNIETDSL